MTAYTGSGIVVAMEFRRAIAAEMKRQGVSQMELERRAGVLQHRISDYLRGVQDVRAETLQRLADALGMELRPKRKR